MKTGYTVWTWLSDEFNGFAHIGNPKGAFEQALREISYLGYETVENFNWFSDYYMDNPNEVVDLCSKYGVEFVCLYHYLTNDFESDRTHGLDYCKFAERIHAPFMNLQMLSWRQPPWKRPMNLETIKDCVKKTNIIAEMARDHGVKLCVHPHANSPVFTPEEIDIFMQETDPDLVSLTLDTAHVLLGGGDVVETFDRHFDRLAYVHLKDLDPDEDIPPDVMPQTRFRALGQGIIDFKGVYKLLKQRGYDGILCVELDRQKVCNFESAQYSRTYLRNVLGI